MKKGNRIMNISRIYTRSILGNKIRINQIGSRRCSLEWLGIYSERTIKDHRPLPRVKINIDKVLLLSVLPRHKGHRGGIRRRINLCSIVIPSIVSANRKRYSLSNTLLLRRCSHRESQGHLGMIFTAR